VGRGLKHEGGRSSVRMEPAPSGKAEWRKRYSTMNTPLSIFPMAQP
jgi:hypothetical protein